LSLFRPQPSTMTASAFSTSSARWRTRGWPVAWTAATGTTNAAASTPATSAAALSGVTCGTVPRPAWSRGERGELAAEVRRGGVLPAGRARRGAEQRAAVQQAAQHLGASRAEQRVGDVAVLRADLVRVPGVDGGAAAEHRQVGVADQAADDVVGRRVVVRGDEDEAGDLVDVGRGHADAGQRAEELSDQLRRPFLVLAGRAVVHGVVEPEGEAGAPEVTVGDRLRGGEVVERGQGDRQVQGRVVDAVRLTPAIEQVLARGAREGRVRPQCVPLRAERGALGALALG